MMVPVTYFHSNNFQGLGAYEDCGPGDLYDGYGDPCPQAKVSNSLDFTSFFKSFTSPSYVAGSVPTAGSNVVSVIDPKTGKQYVPPTSLQSVLPILYFAGGTLLIVTLLKRA